MTRTNRRRFLVLFAAIAALLALFGALALPATAQAQSAKVLVSNMEQTDRGAGTIVDDTYLAAQSFSVPSGGGNYTLTSIEILLDGDISSTNISSLTVSVWSADSSGHPDSSLHTLTNPASITEDVAASFTAPAGATLAAGNTYVVVADYNRASSEAWQATNSDNEDATSVTGWTIANTGLWRTRSGTSWGGRSYALFLRVNGTAAGEAPTPSTDATLSGLTVTAGGTDLVTFASDTTDYTASVANDVAEVTVTAETTDSGASIDYLDASDMTLVDADGSSTGQQVTLAEGDNVIKVKVTAADGSATQTYTVTVNRAACTLNTGDLWCGVVTVEEVKDSGTTIGYGFLGTGALSDTEFSVGTNDYTIDAAWTGLNTFAGQLFFGLSRGNLTTADKAKLVLQVDGHSDPFAFSDAEGPTPNGTYNWASTSLDWSSTSEVTLRLGGRRRPTWRRRSPLQRPSGWTRTARRWARWRRRTTTRTTTSPATRSPAARTRRCSRLRSTGRAAR